MFVGCSYPDVSALGDGYTVVVNFVPMPGVAGTRYLRHSHLLGGGEEDGEMERWWLTQGICWQIAVRRRCLAP